MTIEATLLISLASLLLGIITGVATMRRNMKADDKAEATQITTVIVKLDGLRDDMKDLKKSTAGIQLENKETRERLVAVEESTKQAHKRVDESNKRIDELMHILKIDERSVD